MLHPNVRGTHYEMGYGYGTIAQKKGFKVPEQTKEKMEFGRHSEDEVKKIFPEILDEIRGFANACNASYEGLAAFILSIGAFTQEPIGCSAFAATDGSDIVFGRNFDFYYRFRKYTEAYLTCPSDGYWSLGHSDVFVGREDGVNEKGLAIALTAVEEVMIKPGMNFTLCVRYVLDKCAKVGQGVKALSEISHSTASSYLLADSEGNLAVVEAAPGRVRTRRPENGDGFIVCTNHFLHPEMSEMENEKERCWDSTVRYNAIDDALKERGGEIDVSGAQAILSSHDGYVCFHDRKVALGTLWSVVATLKELRVFRAEGHPCRTEYSQDLRLNKAIESRQS